MEHSIKMLVKAGYVLANYSQKDMIGYGLLRKKAIEFDVSLESLTAFRTDDGLWTLFFKPNIKRGFVDRAMLA